MKVWLVRHAAALVGIADPGLSEVGITQARALARRLAGRPLRAVWSSDSLRALETAALVAEPHGLSVCTSAALRELDFGVWDGRFLGDLWSEEPEAARAWEKDIRRTPPGFGETVDDLERRVANFWSQLTAGRIGGETVVVGHGGSLAALRAVITGETFEASFTSRLDVGGCEELTVSRPPDAEIPLRA